MPDKSYQGAQDNNSGSSDFNAMAFIAKQMFAGNWTATLVLVKAVTNDGGLVKAGTVDVQPMVAQLDGAGNATPHGTIYGLPYCRWQGGVNALIMDPAVGDIGMAVFADHDISSVIKNSAPANPGSRRRFDPADGLYLGGFLNAVPEQFVQFNGDGITVTSTGVVTINGDSVQINCDVAVSGKVTATGEVQGNGIHLSTHHHTGVTTGSGNTGGPAG